MKIINEKQLLEILKLDHKEMSEILMGIFNSIPNSVEQLKLLSALQNKEKISFIAHTLKGETANFGLTGLSQLFNKLEKEINDLKKEEQMQIFSEIIKINSLSSMEFKQKYQRESK